MKEGIKVAQSKMAKEAADEAERRAIEARQQEWAEELAELTGLSNVVDLITKVLGNENLTPELRQRLIDFEPFTSTSSSSSLRHLLHHRLHRHSSRQRRVDHDMAISESSGEQITEIVALVVRDLVIQNPEDEDIRALWESINEKMGGSPRT